MRHMLTLDDYAKNEILEIIDLGIDLKKNREKYKNICSNMVLAMLFEKTSTRTRISFESGMTRMGGHAMFIDWKTTQLKKASLKDEARCIGRFADIILARVFKHATVKEIAEFSGKPTINALCDMYHPCQILADLMTIKEHKGRLEGLKLAYLGDGNNVTNSLIIGCTKVGMQVSVGCPKGYEPSATLIEKYKPEITNDPSKAAKDADIVYTDTWVSMGQEDEAEKRKQIFPPFQVNKKLLGNALFMHCLPAYRGLEVTDEVMDGNQSIIFDEAENRLHAQNALILKLLGKA